jgi:hypothetical protein
VKDLYITNGYLFNETFNLLLINILEISYTYMASHWCVISNIDDTPTLTQGS